MTFGPRFYRLLPDHSVELIADGYSDEALEEWGRAFENDDTRRVAFDELAPGITVSTIFLGLDHNHFGKGPPLLFETMTFDDYDGGEQYRYSTWDQAVEGHRLVCENLKARLHPLPEPETNGK